VTTIQDILYRADGTRFDGTMFITWSSFQAGNGANIATANLTLPIVNGALRVPLVPTGTASAGAQYNITYSNNGVNEFTEAWSVPPSALPFAGSRCARLWRNRGGPTARHHLDPNQRCYRLAE
jgi:hypothetical protein